MDHANLIAIDIHTHAEVSCWNPFDNYGEEYDRAADKYFRNSKRPTIAETIAYYRERKIGLVMFTVLWWVSAKPRHRYVVSGLFALMYGIFRFGLEFVRMPDNGVYIAFGWLTKGQILSLPLIAFGLVLLVMSRRAPVLQPQPLVAAEGKA